MLPHISAFPVTPVKEPIGHSNWTYELYRRLLLAGYDTFMIAEHFRLR